MRGIIRLVTGRVDAGEELDMEIEGTRAGSRKKALAFILIVILIAAIAAAFLLTRQPAIESQPGAGGPCAEFSEEKTAISCTQALAIALDASPGGVEKVSMGKVRIPQSGGQTAEKEAWLVDIYPFNPTLYNASGQPAHKLRVTIGVNEGIGVHMTPLQ